MNTHNTGQTAGTMRQFNPLDSCKDQNSGGRYPHFQNNQYDYFEDDDVDVVPNENIKLVGVARSEKSSDDGQTPIESIKLNAAHYQDEGYNRLKKVKSRDRYIGMKENEDTDEEHQYNIEETQSQQKRQELHLGQLIFNNHNFVQNINMYGQNPDQQLNQYDSARSPVNASQGYLGNPQSNQAQNSVYSKIKHQSTRKKNNY